MSPSSAAKTSTKPRGRLSMVFTTGMSDRFLYRRAGSIASRDGFPKFRGLETSFTGGCHVRVNLMMPEHHVHRAPVRRVVP
jgi:hypothetical protein